jgi:carboxymethylenebutenolidase
MCYDDTARPPYPPGASGAARGEAIELTASDGNRFAAYAAHPEQPARAQVAIFGGAGGLRPFYKELALRFAEVGIETVAIDYFGRSAGHAIRDDSFDFMPHLKQLKAQELFDDTQAALAHLRTDAGGERATFTVGFCMGGALSFITAASDVGLAGAIGFYAYHGDYNGTYIDRVEQIKCPVLGMFGDADHAIPVSIVQTLDEKLDKVGVEHEIVIYPGAPHGFFERQMPQYADDAWKRVLGFIHAHTGDQPSQKLEE